MENAESDIIFMATNQKIIWGSLFAAICLVVTRQWVGSGSFPGLNWDYATHHAIIDALRAGIYFPELHKDVQSIHTVVPWLPIYHGLIGSHLLVLFITIFGVSTSAAMGLVSDLALVMFVGSLMVLLAPRWRSGSLLTKGLVAGVIANAVWLYFLVATQGFFAQAIGFGFYLFSWALGRQQPTAKLGFAIVCASLVIYPDGFIWFGLPLALRAWPAGGLRKIMLTCVSILTGLLLAVQLSRMSIPGGLGFNYSELLLIPIVLFMLARQPVKSAWKVLAEEPVIIFTLLNVVFVLHNYWVFGGLRFYEIKNLLWAPIFIALALVHTPVEKFKRLSWAVTLAGIALSIIGNEERLIARFRQLTHAPAAVIKPKIGGFVATLAVPGATYLYGDSYFDAESERILARFSAAGCPSMTVFPSPHVTFDEFAILLIASNGVFNRWDLHGHELLSDTFPAVAKDDMSAVRKALAPFPDTVIREFATSRDNCLGVVSDARLAASVYHYSQEIKDRRGRYWYLFRKD